MLKDELKKIFMLLNGRLTRRSTFKDVEFKPNTSNGYCLVAVGKKRMYYHHVIWIMSGKELKEGFVLKHRNGNRSDNRVENLVLARKVPFKSGSKGKADWQSIDIEDLSQEVPKLDMPW